MKIDYELRRELEKTVSKFSKLKFDVEELQDQVPKARLSFKEFLAVEFEFKEMDFKFSEPNLPQVLLTYGGLLAVGGTLRRLRWL